MTQLTTDRSVAAFLTHRQQLIVQLMKLTGAIDSAHRDIVEAVLHRFCQTLVDYLSTGYFRIYGDLISCQSWAAPRQYAIFEATTSTAMAFADRYAADAGSKCEAPAWKLAVVKAGLAEVALALATRFELEDQLLGQRTAPRRDDRRAATA
jgi:regulator of sigma D